ncbi:MAG: TusE/DsrC/DsvC family sulfur relay protein [Firmicutes bacterium]|nr:TusE/DsrC/DsvC family sulfur relay protein [Bacillota bacterium]MCL5040381.1 TusE/DsrC/DsvC family sulfur relay protein [Bacillota bacterium]
MTLSGSQKEEIIRRAAQEGLELASEHWVVLEYVLRYHEEHQVMCNFRTLIRKGGFDKRLLYRLFPGNPTAYLCRLTGFSFPPEC